MALDEKDLEQVTKIIADSMAAQQEAIKKAVSEQTNGALTKALKPIRERLDVTPTKEEAAELAAQRLAALEEERKKATPGGKDPKDLELEALKARLDAAEKKSLKDAQERKESAEKAARTEERSALQNALSKAGLTPELVGPTLSYLIERGSVGRDKDGAIVFSRKGDFGEEQVTLDEGVAGYLKTPEGKAALPQRDVGGSGDPRRPGIGKGGDGKRTLTLAEAGAIIAQNPAGTVG